MLVEVVYGKVMDDGMLFFMFKGVSCMITWQAHLHPVL